MTDKIAICCTSSSGDTREFPSKKFAKMVPAKQLMILEIQEDIGCLYANDIEPITINKINLRSVLSAKLYTNLQ